MLLTHSSLSAQKSTTLLPFLFSPGTPKATVIPALTVSPIHLFRSSSTLNLYQFPTLSTVLSKSFQNLSLFSPIPSLGLYPTTTQTLTLQNLSLIHRILEVTHPKSITSLYHTFPSSFHLLNTGNLRHTMFHFLSILSPLRQAIQTFPF